jgi:predicted dehydrogenase
MALQAGFVGCGNITETHVRAAREAGLGIAAFHGRDRAKAEAMQARYGGKAFTSYEDFLAHRPMDLVVIGTPSALHAEQGIAAAKRKLHVLVEKPIDVTVAKGEALVAAAEAAGVRLGVLFQDRLKPDLVALRAFVRSGGLGRVLLASARVKWHRPPEYYAASNWRGRIELDGGAALINQGVHTVEAWLLGDVTRVPSQAHDAARHESEDVALALLSSSRRPSRLEATTAAPGHPRRVEISGTEGTVVTRATAIAADLRQPAPGL